MEVNVDITVVGGSLAGSSVALGLLKRGYTVAVFDKQAFPRKKICGEGLSFIGLNELYMLGLEEEIKQLPHIELLGYKFNDGGIIRLAPGESIGGLSDAVSRFAGRNARSSKLDGMNFCEKGFSSGFGIGISREKLDDLLFKSLPEEARFPGQKVTAIDSSSSGLRVRTTDFLCNSKYLVLADGAYSPCSRMAGIPAKINQTDRIGFSAYISSPSGRQGYVSVINEKNLDACLTPVNKDSSTLTIMCSESTLDSYSTVPEMIFSMAGKLNVQLPSYSTDYLSISKISRYKRSAFHNRIFVIGDALEQLDPIGGMGMSAALISSRVTADTINSLYEKTFDSSVIQHHQKRLDSEMRLLKAFTIASKLSGNNRLLRSLKTSFLAKDVCRLIHQKLPATSARDYKVWRDPQFYSLAHVFLTIIGKLDI